MNTVLKTNRDPSSSIGILLQEVTRLMRREFIKRAKFVGLTQAQWLALAYLSRNQGINQTNLADMLDVRPITLARLIDKLEENGLVCRQTDPDDRRAFRLYLTDAAQPVIKQIWQYAAQIREKALEGLDDGSREQLLNILCQMKRNLISKPTRQA